jgi:hypothetical protein
MKRLVIWSALVLVLVVPIALLLAVAACFEDVLECSACIADV